MIVDVAEVLLEVLVDDLERLSREGVAAVRATA